ncbi:MAG: ArsR/SmtB family transcription factor [Candidatus Nanopelagicales bacterium]
MEHRVTLASGDILRTRFATSALLEVLLALRTAQTASSPGPYDGWLRAVRPHLQHPDLRLLAPLVRPDGFTPELLGPRLALADDDADRYRPELAADLDALAQRPADVVREVVLEVVDEPAPELRAAMEGVHPGARLADALRTAWEVAVRPWWPSIRRHVEADIGWWTSVSAERGVGVMLERLHPRITWDGETLVVSPTAVAQDVDRRGTGLVLVPSAFNAPRASISAVQGGPTRLMFPTRSIGVIWDDGVQPATDGLATLLGRTRARVLRLAAAPMTTSAMSSVSGMSMATVSEHLAVLRDAGLVSSDRHGREVLYRATRVGWALIEANPETPGAC